MNRVPNRKEIGKRLRSCRGNVPVKEVAEKIGVTRQAIEHYEKGNRIPSDEIKVLIANYYNKEVQEIFFN